MQNYTSLARVSNYSLQRPEKRYDTSSQKRVQLIAVLVDIDDILCPRNGITEQHQHHAGLCDAIFFRFFET